MYLMRSFLFTLALCVTTVLSTGTDLDPEVLNTILGTVDGPDADRFLESDNSEIGTREQFQRCGNRNQCIEGLECVRTGPLGKRCVPMSCLTQAAADLNAEHDLNEHAAGIFAAAGITEAQLIQAKIGAGSEGAFKDTDEFLAYSEAMRNNPFPLAGFYEAAQLCDRQATSLGLTLYAGSHTEIGLGIDVSFQFFTDVANSDTTYFRACGGIGLGAGFEVSALVGLMFSGTPSDLASSSLLFDCDVAAGLAVGMAGAVTFTGIWYLEFTIGIGAGFEMASFSLCNATII